MTKLLILVVCLYGVICIVLYLIQERLLFQPEVLPAAYQYTFNLPFEERWIETADGVQLNALHFTIPEPKGVVLYLHGNAGSLRTWGSVATDFLPQGYDLFIYDYRGYGKSAGQITSEQQLHDDAAVVYRHVRQLYAEEEIIIVGRSLGSGIAAKLAAQNAPQMLILETPYYSLLDLTKRFLPFVPNFIVKYQIPTYRWMGEVDCPVYLFHGTEDDLIPFESSQRLLPLIQSEHELIKIEGGGHNDFSAYPLYQQELKRILQE